METANIQSLNSKPNKNSKALVGMSFSGPLPPPQILDGYEKVCPGSSDRIIKMAEKQSEHRQMIEKEVVFGSMFHEKLGIILGFILSAPILVIGVYLLFKGNNTGGFIAAVPFLAQIIAMFVIRSKDSGNDLDKK